MARYKQYRRTYAPQRRLYRKPRAKRTVLPQRGRLRRFASAAAQGAAVAASIYFLNRNYPAITSYFRSLGLRGQALVQAASSYISDKGNSMGTRAMDAVRQGYLRTKARWQGFKAPLYDFMPSGNRPTKRRSWAGVVSPRSPSMEMDDSPAFVPYYLP